MRRLDQIVSEVFSICTKSRRYLYVSNKCTAKCVITEDRLHAVIYWLIDSFIHSANTYWEPTVCQKLIYMLEYMKEQNR